MELLEIEKEQVKDIYGMLKGIEGRVAGLEQEFKDFSKGSKEEREEYRKELDMLNEDLEGVRSTVDRELGAIITGNEYQQEILSRLMDYVIEGNRKAEEREENAKERAEAMKRETRDQWFKMLSSGGIIFIIVQTILQLITK